MTQNVFFMYCDFLSSKLFSFPYQRNLVHVPVRVGVRTEEHKIKYKLIQSTHLLRYSFSPTVVTPSICYLKCITYTLYIQKVYNNNNKTKIMLTNVENDS